MIVYICLFHIDSCISSLLFSFSSYLVLRPLLLRFTISSGRRVYVISTSLELEPNWKVGSSLDWLNVSLYLKQVTLEYKSLQKTSIFFSLSYKLLFLYQNKFCTFWNYCQARLLMTVCRTIFLRPNYIFDPSFRLRSFNFGNSSNGVLFREQVHSTPSLYILFLSIWYRFSK